MTATRSEPTQCSQSARAGAYEWWQRGVIYQIYPRSFQDSNGDGVGDLRGHHRRASTTSRWLGVDALWLSPIYPSPMADFGYDISDYCDIDPLFGTLADFDALLAEAHAPRAQGHPRLRAEPHLRPAPLVRRVALVARQPEARLVHLARSRRRTAGRRTTGCRNFGGSAWQFDEAHRPVLLPRLPQGAARPQLAQSARSRAGDARRAALLARARRRRVPRRRDLAHRSRTSSSATTRRTRTTTPGKDPYHEFVPLYTRRPARGARHHRRDARGAGRVPTSAC